MSEIKVKHHKFEILTQTENGDFIGTYKNKKYKAMKFEPYTSEANDLIYFANRLSKCGVKVPRLLCIDKRMGYIVRELLEGETVLEYLARENMSDELFAKLFQNAYLAKINHLTLNYSPDKWLVSNGELYYLDLFFTVFDEEKDLIKKYLRFWFPTKELEALLKKNELEYDKARFRRNEYEINKEMVLTTIKYYK